MCPAASETGQRKLVTKVNEEQDRPEAGCSPLAAAGRMKVVSYVQLLHTAHALTWLRNGKGGFLGGTVCLCVSQLGGERGFGAFSQLARKETNRSIFVTLAV